MKTLSQLALDELHHDVSESGQICIQYAPHSFCLFSDRVHGARFYDMSWALPDCLCGHA